MDPLHALFHPNAIAVIGASNQAHRAGCVIMKNLISGGFSAPIMPVTPKYQSVCGILAYPDVEHLPISPDLAILCVNGARLLPLIDALGKRGTKIALVIAAGMTQAEKRTLQQTANRVGIRVIGPNSMGIILPWLNLNASFSPVSAHKGQIAFLSQSAAMCTSILDWASEKNIGFSVFISLGDACDIHMPELLDALMQHAKTQSILLYLDHLPNAREFMSAARALARHRPILVLKNGRTEQGSRLTHQHIDQLAIPDIIYHAAIQRAGLLRVANTPDLFAAVETLSHRLPLKGERLAIISNGSGPAILAADTLVQLGGHLLNFDEETQRALAEKLPSHTHVNHPLDLGLDATPAHYAHCLTYLLDHKLCDAILVIYSPSGLSDAQAIAQMAVETVQKHPNAKTTPLLTQWPKAQRQFIKQLGVPSYRTPEGAVAAFMHLVEYRRNQQQLMETPSAFFQTMPSQADKQRIFDELDKDQSLPMDKTQRLLRLYGFDCLPIAVARTAEEAITHAETVTYPVALKLRAPTVPHTANLGGVILNLRDANHVRKAASKLLALPLPHQGLFVQPMYSHVDGQALRIAVLTDPTFGPVIYLGDDLTSWDPYQDAVAALPPLNMALARYTIETALRAKKIQPRGFHPLDIDELCRCLVKVSQCLIDCPEITELHFHPIMLMQNTHTVLSASMRLTQTPENAQQRLAIRPYPKEQENLVTLKNGQTLLLRPILPEDEPKHAEFIDAIDDEDRYRRFFTRIKSFNHEALATFTQIDFEREMAFVAVQQNAHDEQILGVVRLLKTPQPFEGEFALLVRSDLKGIGLGKLLLQKICQYAKNTGYQTLIGETLIDNTGMIALAARLNFQIRKEVEDGIAYLTLPLSTQE